MSVDAHWESKEERMEKLEDKLKRIKMLMENFPEEPNFERYMLNTDAKYVRLAVERGKWFEELRKAISDE